MENYRGELETLCRLYSFYFRWPVFESSMKDLLWTTIGTVEIADQSKLIQAKATESGKKATIHQVAKMLWEQVSEIIKELGLDVKEKKKEQAKVVVWKKEKGEINVLKEEVKSLLGKRKEIDNKVEKGDNSTIVEHKVEIVPDIVIPSISSMPVTAPGEIKQNNDITELSFVKGLPPNDAPSHIFLVDESSYGSSINLILNHLPSSQLHVFSFDGILHTLSKKITLHVCRLDDFEITASLVSGINLSIWLRFDLPITFVTNQDISRLIKLLKQSYGLSCVNLIADESLLLSFLLGQQSRLANLRSLSV